MRAAILALLLVGCSSEEVRTVEAVEKSLPNYIEVTGTAEAHSYVKIHAQVSGILLRSEVKQGDYVRRDDLLFEIDSKPYQIALDEAEAALAKDQTTLDRHKSAYERNKKLVEKKYLSKMALEKYESQVITSESQVKNDLAAIETAKIKLANCKIYSPIDGRIGIFNVFPGSYLEVNDLITEISEISPIDVDFSISQTELKEIQPQKVVQIEGKYSGTIFYIGNNVVKALVENRNQELYPKQIVTVRIPRKEKQKVILIPKSAVQNGSVQVLQSDNTITNVPVETGNEIGTDIIILKGLKKGDKIVIPQRFPLKHPQE